MKKTLRVKRCVLAAYIFETVKQMRSLKFFIPAVKYSLYRLMSYQIRHCSQRYKYGESG
jgi:hypothetical protein